MKTLKKTLCLVLAVVMVLGLGVMSASAKLDNYPDTDKITYTEAVDVMSGIGILQGDERGFRPTDNITRAEAAKIIAYIMVGDSAQADALKATANPFNDVPVSHWASGYIAYCATAGIIGGMGDGTYHPSDNVTGLAFAKMLLCALGYGVNDEYTGSDWAINVSRDALRLGVFDGNLAGAASVDATREECALYAFNVIHGTEEYDGIQKVTYSALVGNYIADNAFAGSGVVDPNKHTIFGNDFDLHIIKTDADAFERPQGHHWYVGKTTNIISDNYGSAKDVYADDADLQASYTTGVKGSDIFNLLGKTFIDGVNGKLNDVRGDYRVYVNGVPYTRTWDATLNGGNGGYSYSSLVGDIGADGDAYKYIFPDNFTKDNTKTLEGTGNGVQTNVYAWSTKHSGYTDPDTNITYSAYTINHVIITVVDTFMAKVTDVKVGSATKDPVTKVELLSGGYVNTTYTTKPYDAAVTGAPSGENRGVLVDLNTKGFETEEFKEGDYVLITAASETGAPNSYAIQSMVAPTTVTGTIVDYDRDGSTITLTASGDTYVSAKYIACDPDYKVYAGNDSTKINRDIVDAKQHTLYVDEYGYLVAATDIEAASSYVYVAQFGYKADTSNSFDKDNLAADIYFADGHNEIVPINTTHYKDGTKAPDTATAANANVTTNAMLKATADNIDIQRYNSTTNGLYTDTNTGDSRIGLYELTMVKGKAVLTKTPTVNSDTVSSGQAANVTKGISKIGSTYRAHNDTVFFYVHGKYSDDDFSVKAYVGINNVPVSKKDGVKPGDTPEAAFVVGLYDDSTVNRVQKNEWVAIQVDDNFAGNKGDTVYYYTGISYGVRDNENGTWDVRYKVYVDGVEEILTLTFNSYDDAKDHWDDSNLSNGKFFTVRDNAKHTWDNVAVNNATLGKFDNCLFDDVIRLEWNDKVDGKTVFDVNTIFDKDLGRYYVDTDGTTKVSIAAEAKELSYSAQDVAFLDVRTGVPADDLYTTLTSLQKDFVKNSTDSPFAAANAGGNDKTITIAVKYADNDSRIVSVLYLVKVENTSDLAAMGGNIELAPKPTT